MSRKQAIVDLLSGVLNGRISPSAALDAWPNIDDPANDKLMGNAWHFLYHYNVDEDIRAKDPNYSVWQRSALQKILDELKLSK